MKRTIIIGLAALLVTSTSAIPHKKRDLVTVTDIQEVWHTVNVVETVWVDWLPAQATKDADAATSTTPALVGTQTVINMVSITTTVAGPFTSSSPSTTTSQDEPTSILTSSDISTSVLTSSDMATSVLTSSLAASSSTVPQMTYGSAERGTTYTGDITYFATGLGSCGITSGFYDHIVAISHVIMDEYNPGNPNNNPLCGKRVMIQYDGRKYPATVVDRCVGCAKGDLDLSEGFFSTVTNGNTAAGRIHDVTWSWT